MKNLFYILIFIQIFIFIPSCDSDIDGCIDPEALNYNSEATNDDYSCEYLEIGSQYQGGIVFYIDSTGEHGLVASYNDLSGNYEWGCYGFNISGANGVVLGTGLQNTLDIVAADCFENIYALTAATATFIYEGNGYNDWYLPSEDELVEMNNNIGFGSSLGNIAQLDSGFYWSSSQSFKNHARCVVADWESAIQAKYSSLNVRPIRSF